MAPVPRIPVELTKAPFDLEQARQHGVTRAQLRGRRWRRLGLGLYVWSELADEPIVQLIAARFRLPDAAVFTGRSAAWLHGLGTKFCNPIEVSVPRTDRIWRRAGLAVRRCDVPAGEISIRLGLRVTSVLRTIADLSRTLPFIDAVALIDRAMHRRLVKAAELRAWVESHAGYRGLRGLKTALELANPKSESVMETRLRVLLVLAGLPRPKVQVPLYDESGGFIGRPDLYYPSARLAIEYDGRTHRESLAADNRRQNRLVDARHRILRFTAGDVIDAPAAVVSVVRRSLAAKT